jgi:hypothetical protein
MVSEYVSIALINAIVHCHCGTVLRHCIFGGDEKWPINEEYKLLHHGEGVKTRVITVLPKILPQRTNTCSLRTYYISIADGRRSGGS